MGEKNVKCNLKVLCFISPLKWLIVRANDLLSTSEFYYKDVAITFTVIVILERNPFSVIGLECNHFTTENISFSLIVA